MDFEPVTNATINEDVLTARAAELTPLESARATDAITYMDLTTLNGDDTPERVRALCQRAKEPFHGAPRVAAVCVYPVWVPEAAAALEGVAIPVATVASAFPHGQAPLAPQFEAARWSIEQGATEIDMVINRAHALTGDWQALHEAVAGFREACGEGVHLKVILETGELGTLQRVYRAALVSMMAGADFVKTSTGKAKVNATLPAGLAMAHAIRDYHAQTGRKVGLKPAGGIRTVEAAQTWMALVHDEIGPEWLTPSLFRIGASSLLDDVERHLA